LEKIAATNRLITASQIITFSGFSFQCCNSLSIIIPLLIIPFEGGEIKSKNKNYIGFNGFEFS
jgi:hypothetical protein